MGIRNGAPWCNILRKMSLVDFYCAFQKDNDSRLIKMLDKSMDGTGVRGKLAISAACE